MKGQIVFLRFSLLHLSHSSTTPLYWSCEWREDQGRNMFQVPQNSFGKYHHRKCIINLFTNCISLKILDIHVALCPQIVKLLKNRGYVLFIVMSLTFSKLVNVEEHLTLVVILCIIILVTKAWLYCFFFVCRTAQVLNK